MPKSIDVNIDIEGLHEKRNLDLRPLLERRHNEKYFEKKSHAWGASSYGLEKCSLYLNLSAEKQQNLLRDLSQDRIEEAFHIEKTGMAYGAKMTLLSEKLDERELYAFFTGDEARHFEMISRHLTRRPEFAHQNPFLKLLATMVEEAPKKSLVFMVQILLEGWGLAHYSDLAGQCQDLELAANLKSILQDERGHHGSGLLLFEEKSLTKEEMSEIMRSLKCFLQMAQIGPIGVLSRLLQHTGIKEKKVILTILDELNAFEETSLKLQHLAYLMKKAGAHEIIGLVEKEGLLKSFEPQQMILSL